jgi:hypothetical protein
MTMISHLNLKRPVACPVALAPQLLESFFAEYAVDDAAVLALRVPIVLPGLPLLMLARDCVIHLTRVHDEAEMIASYAVKWAPVAGGPFPCFTGRISIPNAEDYESCFVALDGTYEPPLGALGEAFDRTIGRAIAESTGRDLLQRMGTFIEQSSRSIETAKADQRIAAGL